jgi:hypothetical protein
MHGCARQSGTVDQSEQTFDILTEGSLAMTPNPLQGASNRIRSNPPATCVFGVRLAKDEKRNSGANGNKSKEWINQEAYMQVNEYVSK